MEHDHFGGGSVMVWGGISLNGCAECIAISGGTLTAVMYREMILEPIVSRYDGARGHDSIFMQDNARPHTARVSMEYSNNEGITVME